jgi:hypothetical protein
VHQVQADATQETTASPTAVIASTHKSGGRLLSHRSSAKAR